MIKYNGTVGSKRKEDAGLDLYIKEDRIVIEPNVITEVVLDFKTELEEGIHGELYLRSSTGKKGLIMLNSVGIIDSGYRGLYKMQLMNLTKEPITITREKPIAQVIFKTSIQKPPVETDTFAKSERGEGGFGSTDKPNRKLYKLVMFNTIIMALYVMMNPHSTLIVSTLINLYLLKEMKKNDYR